MRPKKVLFFSQDPGGTNALIPIIRELGGTSYIAVIGKDNAIPIYERKGIPFVPINKITNRLLQITSLIWYLQVQVPQIFLKDIYGRRPENYLSNLSQCWTPGAITDLDFLIIHLKR